MRRIIRLIAVFLVMATMAGAVASCAAEEIIMEGMPENLAAAIESISLEAFDPSDRDGVVVMNLAAEMVPLTAHPAMFAIPVPQASGSQTKTTDKATIDYSNASDGYVMVKFLASTSKSLRVTVTGPSGTQYQYRLNADGRWEVFPLSDGSGSYKILVYEQIEGSRYATVNSADVKVTLKDEFAPFIRPNQFVNFTSDSKTTAKAADLTKGLSTDGVYPRVEAVYNYVIKNLTYDKAFAQEVQAGKQSGYVPNVDQVLAKGKGICFDYAALMTAMLRSLGIPSRLVIGYAGEQYHAWIDVYSETEGWINSIIQFNGHKWNLMDPTFASSGKQSADVMKFIGDGKNYSARFLY